jgi:DNA-binding CsgD family transcriptional regulator/PAS domain-containing protein
MRTPLHIDQDELKQLSKLIDRIYEGAMDIQVWQDVPREISQWVKAPRCTLFTPLHTPEQGGFMTAHNLSPLSIELWATKYHNKDLWAQRMQERGIVFTGNVARDQDLATEDEFLSTEMCREFFAPMDVGRVATGLVFGIDSTDHMPVACSCNRPFAEPFTPEDLFRLELVIPHLSRALAVVFRLRQVDFQLACSLSALDLLPQAAVLFSPSGDVFHANPAAMRLLDARDGLSLSTRPSTPDRTMLRTTLPHRQAALHAALREALSPDATNGTHFAHALIVERPSGQPAYALRFSSLPHNNEFGRGSQAPLAIAFIDDGSLKLEADTAVLRSRYGLSEAEIPVAMGAGDGLTVDELAMTLGISSNTVKTHLKHVYDKTGANSRSQLLKLLLASQMSVPTASRT